MTNARWDHPLRSAIFVPGYMQKFLDRARDFPADVLILDLEDSVPDGKKDDARGFVREYLESGVLHKPVFVRVNAIETGLLMRDLAACLQRDTTGVMLSKVRDERDISYLAGVLSQFEHDLGFAQGRFKMLPLIETASAVMRAYDVACASERVVGLAFGGEDYLTDLDGLHKQHGASILVPRSLIVIAARAARIDVLDTPYLDVGDLAGFRREVELARELGFSGQLILHPTQIDIANEVFSPSQGEIEEATRVIAAIEQSKGERGLGVALLDGSLVGPPMLKRAELVLSKAAKLGARSHPQRT
jgi:citrate lyase subunit beta / citryl-CoA lyase